MNKAAINEKTFIGPCANCGHDVLCGDHHQFRPGGLCHWAVFDCGLAAQRGDFDNPDKCFYKKSDLDSDNWGVPICFDSNAVQVDVDATIGGHSILTLRGNLGHIGALLAQMTSIVDRTRKACLRGEERKQ